MSAVTADVQLHPWNKSAEAVRATLHLAAREIRNVLRVPAAFLPAMIIPLFFYFVQSASLSGIFQKGAAGGNGIANYKAFVLPVSILFAMSNEGAGLNLVTDIERGFFDKLLLTPASRASLLIGAMGANITRIVFQGLVVTFVAMATGLTFQTGIIGGVLMVLLASMWGMAYAAIGMAIALKTGNPQATQASFMAVFPMLFLTTSFAPREALLPWMRTAVGYNPITYLLRGMRSFSLTGWNAHDIGIAFLMVFAVGMVTITLAFRAMNGRTR